MSEPLLDNDMIRRLEQLMLVTRKTATGRLKGERRSKRRGSSSDFADFRNYVAGDDLRFLDWNIYGRLNTLFIKLFLEEEDLQVYILIDTSLSMASGGPEKLLYARRVAAALGYLTMSNMDSLTVHTFGPGITNTFGPKRGKVNGTRLFNFLQNVEPEPTTSLTHSLKQFSMQTSSRGIAIVLSDFYDFDGYSEGFRHLFGRNFEVFAIQILSPQELNPDHEGDVRLVDCEMGSTTDISMGKTLLDVYNKTLNTFCEGIRSHVQERGGHYILTSTDTPFERLILDLLRRQGVVR